MQTRGPPESPCTRNKSRESVRPIYSGPDTRHLLPPRKLPVPFSSSTQASWSPVPPPSVVSNHFVTPWAVARQAPLSTEFSGQENWSGLTFLLQEIFPVLGSNPHLLHLLCWQADSLPLGHLFLLPSRFSRVQPVRPHRRQPTRLPHPWDSPGKNTGLGCHFLLQCMKVKSENEVAQLC